MKNKIVYQVKRQVEIQLISQIWLQIRCQVLNQVRFQASNQVWWKVWDQLGDQVFREINIVTWVIPRNLSNRQIHQGDRIEGYVSFQLNKEIDNER